MLLPTKSWIFTPLLLLVFSLPSTVVVEAVGAETTADFVVTDGTNDYPIPPIVILYDEEQQFGVDWKKASALYKLDHSAAGRLRDSALFLQEGIFRLSGETLEIVNANDCSRGIVFTTLDWSPELAEDAEISAALRSDGKDSYNHREAFFIRSEKARLLIVANTVEGLVAAVPELLESVGYEVLGMGPNWTYVPEERMSASEENPQKLSFNLKRTGRPSYYFRNLSATSGQSYGVGTLLNVSLTDSADETVDLSYKRWRIGRRMHSSSMAGFPGHAMQAYHRVVVDYMREHNVTDGFLTTSTIGKTADRPAATKENVRHLWISTDAAEEDKPQKVYRSIGTEWIEANLSDLGANLDLSIPFVREIVLEKMKQVTETKFGKAPDEVVIFGTDPEDGGGYAVLETLLKNKQWYPEYLASRGVEFGQPYVLHGHQGLDQPLEIWDPAAPSDTVFGFNNWLLREYDAWIDSLPEAERLTSTGRSKKELVRCSLYSYNYHDVPPNFNLDPRIRVMIASYPKHRGRGKWKAFATQKDLARSYQVQLPREPSGDYRIISLAYYSDHGVDHIPVRWSAAVENMQADLSGTYQAGIKAMSCETDFNFGKFGLGYYLYTQMLWNAELTAEQLDAIRDRWLQRSYGSAWQEMKSYYDFMLVDNYPVNGPNSWAHALQLIEAADKKLIAANEPAAQRRLDDLKQVWYYYYLLDSGHMKKDDPLAREYAWKGQMSYMVAQHVVLRRVFEVRHGVVAAVGEELAGGPAHYTPEETAVWWQKVLSHWPETPVSRFADAVLADGSKVNEVDLNDLVLIKDFNTEQAVQPFLFNSGYMKSVDVINVATKAGQPIGFQLSWPRDPTGKDRYYIAKDLPYGIEFWDVKEKSWESLVDISLFTQASRETDDVYNKSKRHVSEIRYAAPKPGTYRFSYGHGGNLALLAGLDFDLATGKLKPDMPRSGFSSSTNAQGLTQGGVYIYVPKGTKSLDLEVWDGHDKKSVTLYQGWTGQASVPKSRKVEIGARKTHRVTLEPGEDGSLAKIEGNGFSFPFLYSIPPYWAKSPRDLLVPRAVAVADQLAIEE